MSNVPTPPAAAAAGSPAPTPASAERDDRFPPGIPFIVGNEGAERFSYYGMRAILYAYLVSLFTQFAAEGVSPEALAAADVRATQWMHLFMAGVYLFPMIGAILADRLLGKFHVIFWVSLLYIAGHGVLALGGRLGEMHQFSATEIAMMAGLTLIAVGAGGIKPCVSANVGDQFSAKNGHLVTRVFQIFYFSINFGSFFASLLIPRLNKTFGPEVAFGVPGALMALAALVFWAGRHRFVRVPPKPGGALGRLDFFASSLMTVPLLCAIYVAYEKSKSLVQAALGEGSASLGEALGLVVTQFWWLGAAAVAAFLAGVWLFGVRQRRTPDSGFLAVLLYSWQQRGARRPGEGFWGPARRHFGDEAAEGPPAVLRIVVVFSMISVFWALFDQHTSTWVKQARAMDLALTVPEWFANWWGAPAVVVASALYGAVWMWSWVSNRTLSRRTTLAYLALAGAWLLGLLALQLTRGGFSTITLLPSQLQALNPLFVMLVIPLLNVAVYRPFERRGRPLKPLVRMTAGMFLAALSFVAVALLQRRIEAAGAGHVPVLWQIIPYLVMTTAEVLVSVTGLEFAYTQAPRAMKSTVMGFWLLGVALGNVLVAFLAPLQTLSLSTFFWTFAGLMGAAALVFAVLGHFYRGKTYLQAAA